MLRMSNSFIKAIVQIETLQTRANGVPSGCYVTRYFLYSSNLQNKILNSVIDEFEKKEIWDEFEIVDIEIYETTLISYLMNAWKNGATFYK